MWNDKAKATTTIIRVVTSKLEVMVVVIKTGIEVEKMTSKYCFLLFFFCVVVKLTLLFVISILFIEKIII